MEKVRRMNLIQVMSKVFMAASVAVFLVIAYFIVNLDVLTNWKLTVPEGEIHAGDTIYVTSEYTKLREITGEARRYIECENEQKVFLSYLVNEVPADRRQGKGGTGVEIPIPRGIANLPTTCRIRISINYPVLPFRSVNEVNTSNEFILLPEREEDRIRRENGTLNESATQSTLSPGPSSSQPSLSLPNSTPESQSSSVINDTGGADSPTPSEPEQPAEEPEPTILDTITGIIRSVL